MGPANILSAFVAIGVVLVAGQKKTATPATEHCPPCSKILLPVCGIDEDEETKIFPNSCMLSWCNCKLRAADSDRSFKQVDSGECEGSASNETEIPECFPEPETEPTSEAPDDGPTSRTLNVTTKTPPSAGVRNVTTKTAPSAGVQNVTTKTPPTAGVQNVTTTTPPSAGALHAPGAALAVTAVVTTLLAARHW